MQGGTIQNLELKINAFSVLFQTFHYQGFVTMLNYFFVLPLANVDLNIVPVRLW